MADAVCAALAKGGSVQHMSEDVWDALWSQERRQQVGGWMGEGSADACVWGGVAAGLADTVALQPSAVEVQSAVELVMGCVWPERAGPALRIPVAVWCGRALPADCAAHVCSSLDTDSWTVPSSPSSLPSVSCRLLSMCLAWNC
jgi:hypothetical protein